MRHIVAVEVRGLYEVEAKNADEAKLEGERLAKQLSFPRIVKVQATDAVDTAVLNNGRGLEDSSLKDVRSYASEP